MRDPKFKDRGLDPEDPLVVDILNARALLAAKRGSLVEADTHHREALATARRIEPRGGWATVRSLRYLADLFERLGQAAAAGVV